MFGTIREFTALGDFTNTKSCFSDGTTCFTGGYGKILPG
jgi:hypothetical protein